MNEEEIETCEMWEQKIFCLVNAYPKVSKIFAAIRYAEALNDIGDTVGLILMGTKPLASMSSQAYLVYLKQDLNVYDLVELEDYYNLLSKFIENNPNIYEQYKYCWNNEA